MQMIALPKNGKATLIGGLLKYNFFVLFSGSCKITFLALMETAPIPIFFPALPPFLFPNNSIHPQRLALVVASQVGVGVDGCAAFYPCPGGSHPEVASCPLCSGTLGKEV